ncbi:hypothetical protein EV644_10557 [Kribbella orskensis]|uniref:Uncharacterized protein n=1 Tax=Kribbella orskensis TaxID=2512216 RepID=A0ABY2BKZ8_9ACTN|nr:MULTISPECIES: hypothetical protein [Kribbella]TCN40775.1 hypothetical protein EV642_10457 [Kribbella sp. VKM Ac-2500]TCO24027.1 hypothetical protein EV644_10557 [Kribbella orskensis]
MKAHLDAGADHVAIQLRGREGIDLLPGYEALAIVLQLGFGRAVRRPACSADGTVLRV